MKGLEDLVVGTSFAPVSSLLDGLLKEIARRVELRQRLEEEQGRQISDEAFLEIADRTGGLRL